MERIKKEDLHALFEEFSKFMSEKKEELCNMDAYLGDGDLGLTMEKGFSSLPEQVNSILSEDENISIGKVISKLGMKFSSIVPSTMGFLIGSGFLNAGKELKEDMYIDSFGYIKFLKGFVDGIQTRGKCKKGERTVLDSIISAYEFSYEAYNKNIDISLVSLSEIAYKGALKGLEDTKFITPIYGKAAVHKDKAIGVEDQGAKVGMYIISVIKDFITRN